MKHTKDMRSAGKSPTQGAVVGLPVGTRRGAMGASATSKKAGVAAKGLSGPASARHAVALARQRPAGPLKVTIEVDSLVDVVRQHVRLSPSLVKVIKGDFVRLLQNPTVTAALATDSDEPAPETDPVLGTQEAADLVGVSRPYIVARIDAGDIPLHQQIGHQRRVLKSAVLAWNRRAAAGPSANSGPNSTAKSLAADPRWRFPW